MPFDFSPVGIGLGAITSVAGLLGASSAQKRARERRNQIMEQLKADNAREYMDVMTGNQRSIAARAGGLNSVLESTGRALGSANAQAGVTNSSAVAGSLALGAQGIQKALTDYQVRNRQQEQGMLNAQKRQLTGMELGMADQDYQDARSEFGGYVDAFGNLISMAGQFGNKRSPSQVPGGAGGSLPEPGQPYTLSGGIPAANINPIQSWMQTQTQKNRKLMGGLDVRTIGPMMNGGQGSRLPGL